MTLLRLVIDVLSECGCELFLMTTFVPLMCTLTLYICDLLKARGRYLYFIINLEYRKILYYALQNFEIAVLQSSVHTSSMELKIGICEKIIKVINSSVTISI